MFVRRTDGKLQMRWRPREEAKVAPDPSAPQRSRVENLSTENGSGGDKAKEVARASACFGAGATRLSKTQLDEQVAEEHEVLVGRLMIRLPADGTPGSIDIVDTENGEEVASVNSDLDFTAQARLKAQRTSKINRIADSSTATDFLSRISYAAVIWFAGHPRQRAKKCVIYHGSSFKRTLDLSIAFAALSTSIVTPTDLAFDVASNYDSVKAIDEVRPGKIEAQNVAHTSQRFSCNA